METSNAVAEFLLEGFYQGLADSTLELYRWALRRLASHCPNLPTHGRQLLPVIGDRKLAHESRKDLRRMLNTFFGWCQRNDYLDINPIHQLAPMPRQKKKLPRVLTMQEIEALWRAAETPRDQALLAIVLENGIRLGEIAGLRKPMLGSPLRVEGKSGTRYVPISPETLAALQALGDKTHVWLGKKGPLTRWGVRQAYERMLARAGISGPKTDGPHVLRHTYATHYIANGGNVVQLQAILGHSSLATTMRYVHLAQAHVVQDHARHSPFRALIATLGDRVNQKGDRHARAV